MFSTLHVLFYVDTPLKPVFNLSEAFSWSNKVTYIFISCQESNKRSFN